jgi:NADH:ubiquinone oxidoreductase subunit D
MGRIGGFERDWSPEAFKKLDTFLEEFPVAWKEFENLFERNRIFIDRTVNVGPITAEKAMLMDLQVLIYVLRELIMMFEKHNLILLMKILI